MMPGPMCFIGGCLAQIAVIFINGLVIWAATKISGEREKGFRVALKTSLLEIIILYFLDGGFFLSLFMLALIQSSSSHAGVAPLQSLVDQSMTFSLFTLILDMVNLILIAAILLVLIRAFYKFETRRALKAAGLVVLFDFMFGVTMWFFVMVSVWILGYWGI